MAHAASGSSENREEMSTTVSPPRPFTYLPVDDGANIYDANGTRLMKVEGECVAALMNGELTPDEVFDRFAAELASREPDYCISWERVNEPPTFGDLRRMAHHARLRPLLDQRKSRIAPAPWGFEAESKYHSGPEVTQMRNRLQDIFSAPDGVKPFQDWMNMLLEDMMVIGAVSVFIHRPDVAEAATQVSNTTSRPYFRLMDPASIGLLVDDKLQPPPMGPFAMQMTADEPIALTPDHVLYVKRWPVEGRVYSASIIEHLAANEHQNGALVLRESRDRAIFNTFEPVLGDVAPDREWVAEKVIDELVRRVFGETHCRFRWKV